MNPEVLPAAVMPTIAPAGTPSRWRNRVSSAHPDWTAGIAALAAVPIDERVIDAVIAAERGAAWRDEAHLQGGLRRARTRIVAALIDRDLDGRADLDEVLRATTGLAEAAVGEALPYLSRELAARHGIPHGVDSGAPQDLLVIGMGKLGGGELNVSSDIDLIFVHAEDGETRPAEGAGKALTCTEFFTRVGKKLIATLSEVTADGFVFRVDMRLRPDGDAGPLVMHFAMLERYLVTSARDWERFAWIKARVVSPRVFALDDTARHDLDALVTPFVYRGYLDFGAIDALRRLHGQIRDEAERREGLRRGRSGSSSSGSGRTALRIDVKLGRGGIREIEFIAQHFQLIRGGRDTALRLRPTRATLDELVRERLLDAATGVALQRSYAFLRNVEHRLQYLDDAQTHTLPAPDDTDACERVAAMCARLLEVERGTGFDALVDALQEHRSFVEAQFDAVFGADRRAGIPRTTDLWAAFSDRLPSEVDPAVDDGNGAALRERLVASGFAPPDDAFNRLAALARGARLRRLSASSRAKLDALVPRLIDAAGATTAPETTLARWLALVEAIAGRAAYLALLEEYPVARAAVTRLLVASPWAAQYLARHPLLLDELIDAPQQDRAVRDDAAWRSHWRDVAATLALRLARAAEDPERQMDVLRETHHVETFRLLIDDLEGRLTIEVLSDQVSALADLVIDATVAACWSSFAKDRPEAPATPGFGVIAFGKLGGKELGYVSDLDLVFLFDGRSDAAADGDAMQTYARFAQRLNVWLTARTPAGALFEIDLRLRPDGAAGLVVSSLAAWSRYERREHDVGAWTWEHQALTRARFCAGDRALGAAFEAERIAILAARGSDPAARAALRGEIVAMRRRMHDGHPNRSGLFDLKHDDGGMVDIEFAVQYLVLGFGAAHRELLVNVGNIALLTRAAQASLVDPDLAADAARAYRTYRARQHALRLAEPDARAARVPQDVFVDERRVVRRLWTVLFD
jgi:glutamate-ammonia-ligase adenylyltransferase